MKKEFIRRFKVNWTGMAEPDVKHKAPQVRVQNKFQENEIPLAVMAGRMKKFSENTSTMLEVEGKGNGGEGTGGNVQTFFSAGYRPS